MRSEWELINKDVRFVIHVGFPKSIESYIQEWGRAGRDSLPAKWILYYNYSDRRLLDYFIINNKNVSSDKRKEENLHSLYKMIDYLEERWQCRRKLQLLFLGENFKTKDCNKNWDNWENRISMKEINVTNDSKIILDFVGKTSNHNLTMLQIISILRGTKWKGISANVMNMYEKYNGKMKAASARFIQRIIIKLLILRILKENFVESQYGINSYIELGDNWRDLQLKGK